VPSADSWATVGKDALCRAYWMIVNRLHHPLKLVMFQRRKSGTSREYLVNFMRRSLVFSGLEPHIVGSGWRWCVSLLASAELRFESSVSLEQCGCTARCFCVDDAGCRAPARERQQLRCVSISARRDNRIDVSRKSRSLIPPSSSDFPCFGSHSPTSIEQWLHSSLLLR
jgi:hypothetical protein